jgi:molybdenum cofactor cytidylyltransferase
MDAPQVSDLGVVVVLAAGRSSRMGEPKGLVPFRGRPWLLAQLDAIASAGGRAVIVLGTDRERYLQALPGLAQRARLAFNDDPDRGPFSSLQCGLAAATSAAPAAAVFVLPVDVPAASPAVWRALRQALAGSPTADAVVPELEGRGGHPVLLSPSTAALLQSRPATSRLDVELAALPQILRAPVKDPFIRLNLNAPPDWGKLEAGQ